MQGYITILRIDYWFKNVFMIPGMVLALFLHPDSLSLEHIGLMVVGVLATCLVASANYVINEYLDAEYDRHHPVKKSRPAVTGAVSGRGVLIAYALLIISGLGLSALISSMFLVVAVLFLMAGFAYNVPPIRTKERVYLDILSESLNNPIRFLLGWSIFVPDIIPPSSILIAYWSGGAFLMAIKRFAEYRYIGNPELAGQYRRSFQFYTEDKLLVSSFFYALTSTFFIGIFLIKYRIEFLVLFPFISLLFTNYLKVGLKHNSAAQNPEQLFKEKELMAYVGFLLFLFVLLSFVDLPWLALLAK
uniref:UbiA prenyltransferase n=1 Tax=Magnetococcus massalia (strain MO-1) TaxID=451514 RepID=A0A1S7LCD6_MAGMO|nr:Conserved protein of unknown function. putative 4-hydroxybenzoate polyprenyltransferase-like prenyltransferase [Candidatus Magnetococcus massalia]